MGNKIRLGLIGASIKGGWSARSHLPAILANNEIELTAVCTTKAESAEATREAYGASFGFSDYREMLVSSDIDAVAVVVRVPSHYEPTRAALEAQKHVYCEWPLGRTTKEALELLELAKDKGVKTATGLQARVNPALIHMKNLISDGYVGRVMSVQVSLMRDGILSRPSNRSWQRDESLGANTLTIANGHTIDSMRFVVGDFSRLSAMISTQADKWFETDTNELVSVSSPDNVIINGFLYSGAIVSSQVSEVPFAGSGYRMEIHGSEGTLVATSRNAPQLGEVFLSGAKKKNKLSIITVPDILGHVVGEKVVGEALNVGLMYSAFVESIRENKTSHPTFETALELHRLIDGIKQSSDSGHEIELKK